MLKKTIKLYGVSLILSVTLSIVLIALGVERQILTITGILFGSLLGTFVLDLDYIIQILFIEPDHQYAGVIKEYLKHKDILGTINFIAHHRHEFHQRALNSALFQIVFGALTLFVVTSVTNPFLKTLILSTFLNSIYRFVEEFLEDRPNNWFWSINMDTKPLNIYIYLIFLLIALVYSIYLF